MTTPVRRHARAWAVGVGLLALGGRVAGQEAIILSDGRQVMPTPGHDVGYVTPPIRAYGRTGVVARDGMDKKLILLPATGMPTQEIGEFGEGPGQWRATTGLWVNGDSVVLTDQSLRRATVFDAPSGGVTKSWRLGLATTWRGVTVRPLSVVTASCWLGAATRAVPRRRTAATVETIDVMLLVNESGKRTTVDSVLTRVNADQDIRPLGLMAANRAPSVVATAPRLAVAPNGARFAVVEAVMDPEPAIVVHPFGRPCAEPAEPFALTVRTRELTVDEVKAIYRKVMAWRSGGSLSVDEIADDAVRQTKRVNGKFFAPLFSDTFMDEQGTVWIEVHGRADIGDFGEPRRWWRVTMTGKRLPDVIVPPDVRLQSATPERILGWRTRDEGGAVIEFRWPKK